MVGLMIDQRRTVLISAELRGVQMSGFERGEQSSALLVVLRLRLSQSESLRYQ